MFDRQRVRPSALACELVVAAENAGIPEETSRASSPHPYAVSFACDLSAFTLVTLHVVYGPGPQDRVAELQEIAGWLARWARQGDAWGTNLIALGDFNIDRTDDPLHQAVIGTRAAATGRAQPGAPHHFEDPDPAAPPEGRHFYDQIARFADGPGVPALSLRYVNAGMFNFAGGLGPAINAMQLSWWISDHFPLWVEFRLRL